MGGEGPRAILQVVGRDGRMRGCKDAASAARGCELIDGFV